MSALTPVSFAKPFKPEPRLSPLRAPGRTNERFWTEAEKAIIQEHYPIGGSSACKALLPNRSIVRIYARAQAMKVAYVGRKLEGPKKRTRIVKPSDQVIIEGWALLKGRGAVQRFADELGVERFWLSDRAATLGLSTPHRKEPPWTEAETALMARVPLHNPDRCARIFREHGFHRTPTAIMIRAKRLSLSRRKRDTFSATMAAELLGMDAKTIGQWCVAGDIAAVKRDDRRLPQQGGSRWEIAPAELRRYILENLDRIDLRKVEKFAFVALIVGEPTDAVAA